MDSEEESRKEEGKDSIDEVEDKEKNEEPKSRKKSRPKNKKKGKTSGKSRKKKTQDIESGNSAEEKDNIEEEEVKEENKGDAGLLGVSYYKADIENYLNQFKDEKMIKLWKDLIFNGVNYINLPTPVNGWGKRQNFLFIYCGDMIRQEALARDDYDEIEKIPELVYYTIALYENEKKVVKKKEEKTLYITLVHLYFESQIRLPIKIFNTWIHLDKISYRETENYALGGYANKQVKEIYLKIKNENKLPKSKYKKEINRDAFITELNNKIKLINKDNPAITIIH